MFKIGFVGIRNTVDVATKIVEYYYNLFETKKLSEKEAQEQALVALQKLRYSGNEYFWVNDVSAHMLRHPVKPKFNGKNLTSPRSHVAKHGSKYGS